MVHQLPKVPTLQLHHAKLCMTSFQRLAVLELPRCTYTYLPYLGTCAQAVHESFSGGANKLVTTPGDHFLQYFCTYMLWLSRSPVGLGSVEQTQRVCSRRAPIAAGPPLTPLCLAEIVPSTGLTSEAARSRAMCQPCSVAKLMFTVLATAKRARDAPSIICLYGQSFVYCDVWWKFTGLISASSEPDIRIVQNYAR